MGNDSDILHASRDQIDRIQLAGIQKTVIDVYEHIPFYKKSFDEAGFDLYSVKSLDDVMKTFPEMSSWYQIEVDTDHRSLDIVTLKAEPNPDVDLDSIADIDRLQKRISAVRRLDARGRWLQGAHAG